MAVQSTKNDTKHDWRSRGPLAFPASSGRRCLYDNKQRCGEMTGTWGDIEKQQAGVFFARRMVTRQGGWT